jgi:hypothetical protein
LCLMGAIMINPIRRRKLPFESIGNLSHKRGSRIGSRASGAKTRTKIGPFGTVEAVP